MKFPNAHVAHATAQPRLCQTAALGWTSTTTYIIFITIIQPHYQHLSYNSSTAKRSYSLFPKRRAPSYNTVGPVETTRLKPPTCHGQVRLIWRGRFVQIANHIYLPPGFKKNVNRVQTQVMMKTGLPPPPPFPAPKHPPTVSSCMQDMSRKQTIVITKPRRGGTAQWKARPTGYKKKQRVIWIH